MGAFAVNESVLSWPGDLVIAWGWAVVLASLQLLVPVPPRGRESSWSARSPLAPVRAPGEDE